MAQVKSMLCRSSSNIFGNDAVGSQFNLEICDESPPKGDFDTFLKDIYLSANSLQLDELRLCESPQVNDFEIFGSLSSNDSDSSSGSNIAPTASSVKIEPCFNFDFSDDDLLSCVSTKESNKALDLSVAFTGSDTFLTGDQPDGSVSLAALAKNHFSNSTFVGTEKQSKGSSALSFLEYDINCSTVPHSPNSVTLRKSDNLNLDYDVLKDLCINDAEDQPCIAHDHQVNIQRDDILNENSIEDIDLSFCMKNTITDGLLSSSPESRDSGFDESDLPFKEQNKSVNRNTLNSMLHNPKPSLLSVGLSCKRKSDNLKREKVLKIKRELCQNYLIRSLNKLCASKPVISDRIVDQSNSCVISDLIK